MKKLWIISLITLVFIGGGFYFFIVKPPVSERKVSLEVVKHFERKGITKDQYILQINYHWENRLFGYNPYNIKVTFKDEAKVNYFYEYDIEKNRILQTGLAPTDNREDKNFKHTE